MLAPINMSSKILLVPIQSTEILSRSTFMGISKTVSTTSYAKKGFIERYAEGQNFQMSQAFNHICPQVGN